MKFENQYLTYDEYQELEGKLQQMPFNLLECQARKEVDKQTFNRFNKVNEYPIELKTCIFKLIEVLEADENPILSSDGIGTYNPSKISPEEIRKTKRNIIQSDLNEVYVDGIRATYCGADEN